MSLRLAISPCPNDTFIFHALVHGQVPGAPSIDVTYADVDVTNTAAAEGVFDLVKVSYAALPWLLDDYELLPCGGALGRGCGPLVLARDPRLADLRDRTIAVPGDRTTAYLLLRLWAAEHPPREVTVLPFHEIMPAVAAGRVDAGLVIHEARFTYSGYGLHAIADLGQWWENETGLPIPLGAILARRGRVDPLAAADWIRRSLRRSWADPAASRDYVVCHAQEMDPAVLAAHIDLYVNEFSDDLGAEGYAAVNELLCRAGQAGLVPAIAPIEPRVASRPRGPAPTD